MQDTKVPALSRTWKTHNTVEVDGAVICSSTHTVTLSRAAVGAPLAAQVDGKAAELKAAVLLLEDAWKVEVLEEVLTAPSIGKARAHRLHKIMARLGLHDHYGVARRACGMEGQCFSLAALSELEARQVWAYLLTMFPLDARTAAA